MATPPMLRTRGSLPPGAGSGPDPVVWLAVGLMALVALGLVIAGVLAVYDVATPPSLAPLVRVVVILFAATLVILVGGAALRRARRAGR